MAIDVRVLRSVYPQTKRIQDTQGNKPVGLLLTSIAVCPGPGSSQVCLCCRGFLALEGGFDYCEPQQQCRSCQLCQEEVIPAKAVSEMEPVDGYMVQRNLQSPPP